MEVLLWNRQHCPSVQLTAEENLLSVHHMTHSLLTGHDAELQELTACVVGDMVVADEGNRISLSKVYTVVTTNST